MMARGIMAWLVLGLLAGSAFSQAAPETAAPAATGSNNGWRRPGETAPAEASVAPSEQQAPTAGNQAPMAANNQPPLEPVERMARSSHARVSKGSGTLPNDHGQVWREYDISPYTARVTSTNKPEQAIVDWILRETGYETWHSEPLGILSADSRTLRVYHTPEMQAVVAEIVDRFVSSEAETQAFNLQIVTIEDPNWRAKALRLMTPVPVQSQGVQGWLMSKEDAALMLADLRKRNDFRYHSSPHLLVHNGQSIVVSTIRPRPYVKGAILREGTWPGYEPEMSQIDEGFALEFSPLLSLDSRTVDAIVKLRLSQVEKMVPVMLEVPTVVAPRQRTRIEVPQMTMCNMHERFRWPTDQVLLLSMGVVANPAPEASNPLTDVLPIPKTPSRADALLFVECKGKITAVPGGILPSSGAAPASTTRSRGNYPARY